MDGTQSGVDGLPENRRERAAMRPVAISYEEETKINGRHGITSAEV
jgi:hypothetical protein